jgi:hypothetical protein
MDNTRATIPLVDPLCSGVAEHLRDFGEVSAKLRSRELRCYRFEIVTHGTTANENSAAQPSHDAFVFTIVFSFEPQLSVP